jgi:hypothetical protein
MNEHEKFKYTPEELRVMFQGLNIIDPHNITLVNLKNKIDADFKSQIENKETKKNEKTDIPKLNSGE